MLNLDDAPKGVSVLRVDESDHDVNHAPEGDAVIDDDNECQNRALRGKGAEEVGDVCV